MEIHLDLLGGMAGDMFIAAMLDAFPQHEPRVKAAIACLAAHFPVAPALVPHSDGVIRGRRFLVAALTEYTPAPSSFHLYQERGHEHSAWKLIHKQLRESALSAPIREHAIGIFNLLAEAEGYVHGVDPSEVSFHEVGAVDSVADIVGAAAIIDAVGATAWTASAAPLGSGRVRTAHGLLPVPAPATTRLLIDMETLDDGIAGERVTPTGAAILRYLCGPENSRRGASGGKTLVRSGTGFGSRVLRGISNHLRVLCFEKGRSPSGEHREISVLEFEIDDQSGEDLAAGLDRLRGHPGVLDVTQSCVYGKKGRMMTHLQVLARQAHTDAVIDACFRETTTIGLRCRTVKAIGLDRTIEEVEVDGQRVRVKIVDRPGGRTAKAESDDVLPHAEHNVRAALRKRAERSALRDEKAQEEDA
jgi:uncharacterized protein (TIGR00299 family) protein